MSERDGISIGKNYEGQETRAASQGMSRLDVDRRAFTFNNGCIAPVVQGRVEDPTGDSEEAVTLRTLLGLLRNGGFIA